MVFGAHDGDRSRLLDEEGSEVALPEVGVFAARTGFEHGSSESGGKGSAHAVNLSMSLRLELICEMSKLGSVKLLLWLAARMVGMPLAGMYSAFSVTIRR